MSWAMGAFAAWVASLPRLRRLRCRRRRFESEQIQRSCSALMGVGLKRQRLWTPAPDRGFWRQFTTLTYRREGET
jgi:hypothetical protein